MRLFYYLFWILLIGVASGEAYGQCTTGSLAGTAVPKTRVGTTVTGVAYRNYVRIAVVQGIEYTFKSTRTSITVRDDLNTTTLATTSTVTQVWTSDRSGYIRMYNCNTNSANLSVEISGGSNSIDSRADGGDNVWIEYLYQRLDNVSSPPSNANAFSRYLGYRDTLSETFSNDFGNTAGTYSLKSQKLFELSCKV